MSNDRNKIQAGNYWLEFNHDEIQHRVFKLFIFISKIQIHKQGIGET